MQQGASKYNMEELEEFLQSLEACLPKSLQTFQHAGEHEIEALLNAIAACPEMDPMSYFSPQVPKNSLSLNFSFSHIFLFFFMIYVYNQLVVSQLLDSYISDYMMGELFFAHQFSLKVCHSGTLTVKSAPQAAADWLSQQFSGSLCQLDF